MMNPFAEDFGGEAIQTLYRKMKKTAKARFNGAKRLSLHQTCLLWSTSLFSMGLVIFPLLTIFGVASPRSVAVDSFSQIGLALLVLVFSLILNGSNFSGRSENMHRCGLAINNLCHRALPACGKEFCEADYRDLLDAYQLILEGYENHSNIDADLVRVETEGGSMTQLERVKIQGLYYLQFSPYVVLIVSLIATVRAVFIK